MNILIFRTPYNSIYIRIFRPHMYSRMLLSLGIAFIQLSRNEITNMTLQQLPRNSIERILYTSFVRLSRKIIELFKIYANRKFISSNLVRYIKKKLISKERLRKTINDIDNQTSNMTVHLPT